MSSKKNDLPFQVIVDLDEGRRFFLSKNQETGVYRATDETGLIIVLDYAWYTTFGVSVRRERVVCENLGDLNEEEKLSELLDIMQRLANAVSFFNQGWDPFAVKVDDSTKN